MTEPVTADPVEREGLVRRGRMLAWFTIVWNAIEGVAGIAAGIAAGSIALIGFGVDSYVEVFAGSVIIWRLSKERHGEAVSEAAEQRAVRLIALTFLFLAVGVGVESIRRLASGERPDESWFGIGLAVVSLMVMPLLARAKRPVGERLGRPALTAAIGTVVASTLENARLKMHVGGCARLDSEPTRQPDECRAHPGPASVLRLY